MGAYAPALIINEKDLQDLTEIIILHTLKGIKKRVTLFVYSEERYKEDANSLKFRIESSINRHDFGASGYSFLVGKEIKLNSTIELIKEK